MLTLLSRTCCVACGAAFVLGLATPALADPSGQVECEDYDNPECEAGAEDPGDDADAGDAKSGSGCQADGKKVPCEKNGRWLGGDGCYYGLFDEDDTSLKPPDDSGDWTLYMRVCYSGDTITEAHPVWKEDSPIEVTAAMLAQRAVDRLRLPSPGLNVNPAGEQLVGLPSWLWLSQESWQTQQAKASVPELTVTATAKPVAVVWDTGDGSTVECDGPGTAWRTGTDPRDESPDCGYTYSRSSASQPDGEFDVSVQVVWEVSWRGGGQSGTVANLTTTSTASWPVEEVQTVITG